MYPQFMYWSKNKQNIKDYLLIFFFFFFFFYNIGKKSIYFMGFRNDYRGSCSLPTSSLRKNLNHAGKKQKNWLMI